MKIKLSLSASLLKHIALASMLIDHIAAIYLQAFLARKGISNPQQNQLYNILRNIGRLAFPIYCFLIAEGAKHTSNMKKYLLRLLSFAFISLIPFSLAVYGKYITFEGQNVYFTLAGGLLAIILYQYCKPDKKWFLFSIGFIAICALCIFFDTDYMLFGPMLIMFFYLNKDKYSLFINGYPVFIVGTFIMYFFVYLRYYTLNYHFPLNTTYLQLYLTAAFQAIKDEIVGIVAFIPISLYNGEKGKTMPKFFYYLFYPVHLLILFLLVKYTI